jgi:glycosyltransferase involved in cell wall biosynthesis
MRKSVTLVVNTCNLPDYLDRVLKSVTRQVEAPDQLIVAEDGNDLETGRIFRNWNAPGLVPALHVMQEKRGFERSKILNEAIVRTSSDYIVFLDGDSIPHPNFIRDHRLQARNGFFVQGHRTFLTQKGSEWFGKSDFRADRSRALFSRDFESVKYVYRWPVPKRRIRRDLKGIRGCNLGIWRKDLVAVNGYDEGYVGWGCEDLYLAARLYRHGVSRLDIRGHALCYHLWHPLAERANLEANLARLEEAKRGTDPKCSAGLNLHGLGESEA